MSNEEEIWKIYPDYDFIEVSNLGRVRTKDRVVTGKDGKKYHIKGRILKQQKGGSGYMQVHFSINGKTINLYIHRAVAISFLPNPDNLPEVNHIDNDRTNNVVSNLEWCTREYNIAYREKYGVSAAEAVGRPVFAVNLKTGKILYFESQSEATHQLGINQGHVGSVARGELNQIGGYWFTRDESEITNERIQEIKDRMVFNGSVIAINIKTSNIFLFKSQSEAGRQLGVDNSSIAKVVKGKLNKAGGCWFCNVDENAVEKTRAKFGNEMAEKVEELIRKYCN